MSDDDGANARSVVWLLERAAAMGEDKFRRWIRLTGGDPEPIMPAVRQYLQMSPSKRAKLRKALLAEGQEPSGLEGALDRLFVGASALIGLVFGVDGYSAAREHAKSTRGWRLKLFYFVVLAIIAGLVIWLELSTWPRRGK